MWTPSHNGTNPRPFFKFKHSLFVHLEMFRDLLNPPNSMIPQMRITTAVLLTPICHYWPEPVPSSACCISYLGSFQKRHLLLFVNDTVCLSVLRISFSAAPLKSQCVILCSLCWEHGDGAHELRQWERKRVGWITLPFLIFAYCCSLTQFDLWKYI